MSSPKDPELQFNAITEGLGFHPFSDGLPYAPVAKTQQRQNQQNRPSTPANPPHPSYREGAGAVAAGPARPAPPLNRSRSNLPPRVSVPTSPAATVTARPATPQTFHKEPQTKAFPETRYGLGYLFKRVLAYLLDSALNLSICLTGLSVVLIQEDVDPQVLANSNLLMITTFFLVFFNWAIITAQEVAFGTTLGKRIFGLTLRGSVSAAFLRAFFFLPSAGFLGAGLLWSLFDRRRRCWHDIVVDLQPEEIAEI